MPPGEEFPLLALASAFSVSGDSPEQGWKLRATLTRGPWLERLIANGLDILTLVAISLIFMVEMFLLLSRSLEARLQGTTQSHAHRSALFRPLMFVFILAMDMTISFIPLRMAERLGYGPVFAISAVILACLALVPLRLLRGQEKQENVREEAPAARLTLPQIRRLLADRHFLAFILLALLPSTLLCVGFLNYFLPVFLKQADVAQSNIGRIYMLNCLIVIYSGPLFARLVGNSLHKGPLLFWAGILSALSVACFCFLPPLPASVAGSILLGLATGLNIPAQSEFLLELDIARAIGVDQAMSLLDALQRVGQVIGPVCVGAVMAIMSVDDAARWAGIILVAISLLFLLLVRPARHSGDRA